LPIQILPARLANQIAAGEVVERPASVVKELLENSLDSGATSIEIEIEKGGHKRILIRDNGSGIPKDELALALSRHATSKISKLDDLEAIVSLGFRGEALASISSVARLTLSSKPAGQTQAWQACTEGRDMEVQLNPVAHPDGSSVDVVDLFFNTPARRKFLRTEKTEFTHIDELVRRIALSRFDVSFSLKHNNKLLRKYPAVKAQSMQLKRIGAICGKDFAQNCIELNSQYEQFELKGWVAQPDGGNTSVDYQYFYVNGRMMRDKLINHAIRQAFEGVVADDSSLAYVLYLTLEPDQVDVNVHPAKHEVRFHKARLVHDFILRALSDALNQYFEQGQSKTEQQVLPQAIPKHDYIQPLQTSVNESVMSEHEHEQEHVHSGAAIKQQYGKGASTTNLGDKTKRQHLVNSAQVMDQSSNNYQRLMTAQKPFNAGSKHTDPNQHSSNMPHQGHWLRINQKQILTKVADDFYLLELDKIHLSMIEGQFKNITPVSQPLLMPISITASTSLLARAKKLYQPLLTNGVEIGWTPSRIILRKVPAGFRQFSWAECLSDILDSENFEPEDVRKHLLTCLAKSRELSDQQVQYWWEEIIKSEQDISAMGQLIPLSDWVKSYVK
jgi:DNA mismatch repair protein MutL